MAVSTDIPTYKFLNHWQRLMQESIWRFNQVQGTGVPRDEEHVAYLQPHRDEVALALDNAVSKIVDVLGYYPRPVWITDEVIPLHWSDPYQLQTLQTRYKHLIEFGSRGTTLISASQAVVYSDSDGDGVNDTATITVATTVTVPAEVQIFFRVADGAPAAADELWEIEPTTVTISGGNAVIVAHRALFVKPSTIWAVPYTFDAGNLDTPHYADIALVADFVTSVDVYRVYNDTTNAIQLYADDIYTNCDCGSITSTVSAAGARITNPRLGVFQVRPTACGCNGFVESVKVNYRAGLALVRGATDPTLAEAIIRFANTHFGQPPIAQGDRVMEKWTYDREPEDRELLTPEIIHNPFGIQRGAIFAWRTINNPRFAIGKGSKLTSNVRI
jgi:hypothetical protein